MSGPLLTAMPVRPQTHQRKRIFVVHPSALLTDHLGNGDGLAANGFLRRLAARGHDIQVACEGVDLHDPLPSNVNLYRLRTSPWPRPVGRLVYLVQARRLYDRLRAKRPFDLVTQLNPVAAGLSLGMRGCGAPIVLGPYVPSWPDDEPTNVMKRGFRLLGRRLRSAIVASTQHAASALLISSEAALVCVDPAVPRNRIYYIPFGVPASLLELKPAPFASDRPLEILFIGGLEPRKGVVTLLEAFTRVVRDLPGVRLRLIGTGRMLSEVQAAAAAAPPGAIVIDGHIASADIPDKIIKADVFCAPSNGEPFGIALIEAMACARAIVATRSGAFPTLLPESGGMLVPPRDPDALASALVRVLESPELREQMGAANRSRVRERYTWDRVIDDLEAVYDEVTDTASAIRTKNSGGIG